MLLTQHDLEALAQVALQAALEAGHRIGRFSKERSIKIESKAGDSEAAQVVTEIDLKSQEIILKHLQPTCNQYDLGLLTEESTDDQSRLTKDYFWCIDPLDGTLPFTEATPGYAVSIALVSQSGVPQIGVIFDPYNQTLYHAIKNPGAFKNQQPWTGQPLPGDAKEDLTFITDRSFLKHPVYPEMVKSLTDLCHDMGYQALNVIQHGGAAMNACWVIDHAPACYFKLPKSEPGGGSLWDFSASACLFNELHAAASDIHGHALDLNRTDSTFMNHHGVLYASDKQLAERVIALCEKLF